MTTPTQAERWNGTGGEAWARRQETLDRVVGPLGEIALTAAALTAGERVLDVGCGCGDTAIDIAARVGPTGAVLGLDVSGPMLARARERLTSGDASARAPVDFVLADASTHALPPAAFDVLFSRFGVMFFDDPAAAFTNLARALRPGGRLAFVCWRAQDQNPWAAMPLATAAKVAFGEAPPPKPPAGAPGPFAFADSARVTRILTEAGFADVRMSPADRDVPLGPSGAGTTRDDVVAYLEEVGPAARLLAELTPEKRAEARAALADALAALPVRAEGDASVWLGAAVWIVTATKPSP
jgi:SAM-dependent methyltransferase